MTGHSAVFDLAGQGHAALQMMSTIREFERRLPAFAKEALLRGSTHPSVGMEAVAVGVSMNLRAQDSVASNHRGHAHCLARGADLGRTLAEIFGRVDGYCAGKGGSMHLAVAELGILGTNGIVGAGIGLATGAALASTLAGDGGVAVAYFGDGASNQGVLAEAMNLAAIWKLPVLFVCENNHYAQSASIEQMVAQPILSRRGEAYGVPSVDVDGMDVQAVYAAVATAAERAREGGGPTLIVADTYRYLGHMADDTEIYRHSDEVDSWKSRDPLDLLALRLKAAGLLSDEEYQLIQKTAVTEVDAAEKFARNSPFPSVDQAETDVAASGRSSR